MAACYLFSTLYRYSFKGSNFLKSGSLVIFFFVLFFSFTTLEAIAATYYISPTGNNTTGDGSIGTPWATLKKVEASISAGDTVYCRGGTYVNHPSVVWNVPASSENPITIIAFPDETPVFSRQNGSAFFIRVQGVGWITFDGLEIEGYLDAFNTRGLPYVDDTEDTVTDYAENITFRNCYVHDSTSHEFYISAGSKNIVINNNIIENAGGFAIHNWHNPGADGLEIYNNTLINCDVNFAVGAWDGKDIKIYNNTVIGGREGLSIYQNSTPSNYEIIVKNNIFYLPTTYAIHERYEDSTASNMTFDNNIFYKPTGTFAWWNDAKVATFSEWQTLSGGDANSIISDPLFLNIATDFHLQSLSPAIDEGTATLFPIKDNKGDTRPYGGSPDIGASEFVLQLVAPKGFSIISTSY
ncbi:MAG: right-handed parallel beta-helix repeat-containing protein [Deltaproteobacteria bacterium]|nr:right-handed parallel beta-helix repeat-containing protein [Deltaproteobacteria bacterium]